MDPLSLAAWGVAFVSIGLQLAETVRKLRMFCGRVKDAPTCIKDLAEDAALLQIVYQEYMVIESVECGQSNAAVLRNATSQALQRCQRVTEDLAALLRSLDPDLSSGSTRRRRWAALRTAFSTSEIAECQKKIEAAKSTLLVCQTLNVQHRMLSMMTVKDPGEALITLGKPLEVQESLHLRLSNRQDKFQSRRSKKRTYVRIESSLGSVEISLSDDSSTCGGIRRNVISARLDTSFYLAAKRFSACFSKAQSSISLNLHVGRRVSHDSEICQAARKGNAEHIRQLFVEGSASPWDISGNGWPPLHYAVMSGNLETCQFLIHAGADPRATDMWGLNCLEWLLQSRSHWPSKGTSWVDALRLLVEQGDFDPCEPKLLVESRSYFVTKKDPGDPLDQLAERTPLDRYQGEFEGFQYLLNYPKSVDDLGIPEQATGNLLRGLCVNKVDQRCLEYWVQLGGDLASHANKGLTLFHILLRRQRRKKSLSPFSTSSRAQLLVKAGFDLHESDQYGLTAIASSISRFNSLTAIRSWQQCVSAYGRHPFGPFSREKRTAKLKERVEHFNRWIQKWLWVLKDSGVDVSRYIRKEMELFRGSVVLVDNIQESQYEVLVIYIGNVAGEFELRLVFDAEGQSIRYEHYKSGDSGDVAEDHMIEGQPPGIALPNAVREKKSYMPKIFLRLKYSNCQRYQSTASSRSSIRLIESSFDSDPWSSGSSTLASLSFYKGPLLLFNSTRMKTWKLSLPDSLDGLRYCSLPKVSVIQAFLYALIIVYLGKVFGVL